MGKYSYELKKKQHAEYQRLLVEHNIKQSMSRKGDCI